MLTYYNDYEDALSAAIEAIVALREAAEKMRDELEETIQACETLEESI